MKLWILWMSGASGADSRRQRIKNFLVALVASSVLVGGASVRAQMDPTAPGGAPAIAMHGEPALDPGFDSFPYVNPDAPKGGRITFGRTGGFDSLNPFILRGRAPREVRSLVVESLMARSWDEPFTLYGLLAERVEVPADRSAVTFYIHPDARFSNGAPVTPEDVIWSMETLRDQGRPNHRAYYGQIAKAEVVGERGVRFVFEAPNRELPLLMGLMPVLSKADWEGLNFQTGELRRILGSGPYVIAEAEPGRRILYQRNPDYWGADLPVNRGRHNFDEIEHVYFRNGSAIWEAFTAGQVDLYGEDDPARWVEAYDVPAVREGRILRAELDHGRASGMEGFVFNTRRAVFGDVRVRQALALALDYEWINESFFQGGYTRISSYFSGSALGYEDAPTETETQLLAPYGEAAVRGWRPPLGAGDGRNRRNLRSARRLLQAAGWTVQEGVLRDASGQAFQFEILLRNSEPDRIAQVYAQSLGLLGIQVRIRQIDNAQYEDRLLNYDFDMIVRRWGLSLSPGEEQRFYWSAEAGAAPGSRNYMGAADPTVDVMIDALLSAESRQEFTGAVRALDRVLSDGVYVIPFGYLERDLVAWSSRVRRPEATPLYGYGFAIDAWWSAEAGN